MSTHKYRTGDHLDLANLCHPLGLSQEASGLFRLAPHHRRALS